MKERGFWSKDLGEAFSRRAVGARGGLRPAKLRSLLQFFGGS
jgi:hypothetical protein